VNAGEQLIAEGLERGLERGRAEGRAEGLRTAIATALTARGLVLSVAGRAKLEACADVAVLMRWLARAVTASSESEVLVGDVGH
jgi:hypothetical protein